MLSTPSQRGIVQPKLGHAQGTQESFADWRARCLRRAGLEAVTADALARDMAFDLHSLLELLDRGCPPSLAIRIVAPLDWEGFTP
jgi:hypothetical protein